MGFPGQGGRQHRSAGPEAIEPCGQPGPVLAEAGQFAELEPTQGGCDSDLSYMDRRVDIQFTLEPVVAAYQFLDIAIPQLGIAQRFRSTYRLPSHGNACIAE